MKICPQCKRLEKDKTLKFCRTDGTPLIDSGSVSADAGTVKFDSAQSAEIETSILPHKAASNDNHVTAPTTVLPSPQAPKATSALTKPRQRRTTTLVVVIVTAVMAAISAIVVDSLRSRRTQAAIQSIAVMPFVNENGNADVDYLSDGMTETLISSLSELPNMNVKSRSSVFRYKNKALDARTIGKELDVQAVLNGRVMQRGDQLALNLELVNAATENVIWSGQYNRNHADLVTLQSDIARDVSQKLERKLSGAAEDKLAKKYTANPEAYELYLKGRYHWNRRTVDDDIKGLEYFEKAVKIDPNFALAYVGISDAHIMLGIPDAMAGAMSPADTIAPARSAAEKAIELDPNLAEAYASRGHVRWKERDFPGAESDFKHGIELNPNYSYGHLFYSIFLAYNGRFEEGLNESKRAADLDPYSIPIVANLGYLNYLAGRPDEAIVIGKRAVAFDDTIPIGRQRLGLSYEQKGMFVEAISEFQAAVKQSDRVQLALTSLAHAYAASGNVAEARKILAELEQRSKKQFVSPYLLSTVYVALHDKQRALELLENALTANSLDLVQAKTDPKLDPLRDDPRFQEILKKIGFPQ